MKAVKGDAGRRPDDGLCHILAVRHDDPAQDAATREPPVLVAQRPIPYGEGRAALRNNCSSRMCWRSSARLPPLKALREIIALPQLFLDLSISSTGAIGESLPTAAPRRSGVQGDFIALLQKFVRPILVFFRARGAA
jgi:hypothetical protein